MFGHDSEHLYALTLQPPQVNRHGIGCPHPAPRLAADIWPRPGEAYFALSSSGHAPGSAVLYLVGTASTALPVGNCTLLVQPGGPLAATLADAHGISSLPVPLAPQPTLVGFRAYAQAWSLDPTGLRGTDSLEVTIGS